MSALTTLATATEASLNGQTVRELRQLATGQISGYSNMRKPELITALLAEGDRLRQFAQSLDTEQATKELESVSIDLSEYSSKFFKRFKGIVESNLDLSTGETKQTIFADVAGLSAACSDLPGRTSRSADKRRIANSQNSDTRLR